MDEVQRAVTDLETYHLKFSGLTHEQVREVLQDVEQQAGSLYIDRGKRELFGDDPVEDLKTVYILVKMASGSFKVFKKAVKAVLKKKKPDATVIVKGPDE